MENPCMEAKALYLSTVVNPLYRADARSAATKLIDFCRANNIKLSEVEWGLTEDQLLLRVAGN